LSERAYNIADRTSDRFRDRLPLAAEIAAALASGDAYHSPDVTARKP